MELPGPQTIEVRHQSDVGVARRAAKSMAEALEFELTPAEEIALAMSELATNLLKHAQSGKLVLTALSTHGRVGLQIESLDQGPGILEIEHVLADGFSTVGSRGTGLGAVNRLMDEFDISSRPSGTRVVCRKWQRRHAVSLRPCPLGFGVATRPHPGFELNGDAFVIHRWAESALVGVIDGLGHGPAAHRAAEAARHYVETHYDLPLAEIFAGVGRTCRSTRGVVMALARFDWGQNKLAFASIGDIEVRVYPRHEGQSFPSRRGILGLNAPVALVTEHEWTGRRLLVLLSDGLRTHWNWTDYPDLLNQPPAAMARQLLRALAKDRDDATVLVVQQTNL